MPAPDPNFFAAHGGAAAQKSGPVSKRAIEPIASRRTTGRLPTSTLQMSAPSSISEALADVSHRPAPPSSVQVDGAAKSNRKNRRSSRPPPPPENGSSAATLDDIDESFDKIFSSP
jgi:hypothetical protein